VPPQSQALNYRTFAYVCYFKAPAIY
jgi:hypothetical protein